MDVHIFYILLLIPSQPYSMMLSPVWMSRITKLNYIINLVHYAKSLLVCSAKQFGGRTPKTVRTFGVESNQGIGVTNHGSALVAWRKVIKDLCDSEIDQTSLQLKQKKK